MKDKEMTFKEKLNGNGKIRSAKRMGGVGIEIGKRIFCRSSFFPLFKAD